MSFEEYLISKKIESATFQVAEPERWQEWKAIFEQMSPTSFTSQKLYLINPVRRRYPLRQVAGETKEPAAPAPTAKPAPRPVMKPKIQ